MYNNNFPQNMYNNYPYAVQQNFQQQQLPHYEVIKVNGKPGVDAFQMGPNSSVLLLDETQNIVWFVQTDGAGYKTPTPFAISPYVEKPQIDVNALNDEVNSLKAMVIELQNAIVNNQGVNNDGKSNFTNDAKSKRQQRQQPNRNQQPE